MPSSTDRPRSREEEIRSTGSPTSPPGQIYSDPFRRLWAPGQHDPFSGRTSLPNSPGGLEFDFQPPRASFESTSRDFRPSANDYLPSLPLSQLPPPQPLELSNAFASSWTQGSVADQPITIGTRPLSEEVRINPAEGPSRSYPGQSHDNRSDTGSSGPGYTTSRRPLYNRDEFDGPSQLLPLPLPQQEQNRAQVLPQLPVSLSMNEQDEVARRTNDILSQCAFHFVAKYQFPIPLERDKRRVRQAADREWTEWAYLLKRLATKRRIPARVLFDGQIKQLVTTLENSIAVRQTINNRTEPPTPRQHRDDRYMLQLVSSGLQVAKILMDSLAMDQLNQLYIQTEALIAERRGRASSGRGSVGAGGRLTRAPPSSGSYGAGPGAVAGAGGGGGGGGGGAGIIGTGGSADTAGY